MNVNNELRSGNNTIILTKFALKFPCIIADKVSADKCHQWRLIFLITKRKKKKKKKRQKKKQKKTKARKRKGWSLSFLLMQ